MSRYFIGADTFDSREVIERIEDLEELDDPTDDDKEELKALKQLEADAIGYVSYWNYGETFILDSYFEDYARELAEDLYGEQAGWPYRHIDWEAAADELQQDYTEFTIDLPGGGPYKYWAL
jgi:hypothetical protein